MFGKVNADLLISLSVSAPMLTDEIGSLHFDFLVNVSCSQTSSTRSDKRFFDRSASLIFVCSMRLYYLSTDSLHPRSIVRV